MTDGGGGLRWEEEREGGREGGRKDQGGGGLHHPWWKKEGRHTRTKHHILGLHFHSLSLDLFLTIGGTSTRHMHKEQGVPLSFPSRLMISRRGMGEREKRQEMGGLHHPWWKKEGRHTRTKHHILGLHFHSLSLSFSF